jgi:hypothetical protein
MFQICGQFIHAFDAPGRIDKETGEADDDKPKVQILGELPQRNGQQKIEVITLSCHNPEDFEGMKGKRVRVPLGIFSPSKGNIVYFIPQGCKPVLDVAGGGA